MRAVDVELENMIIAALLRDPAFSSKYLGAVDTSSFSDQINRNCVNVLLIYYNRYNHIPTRTEYLSTLTAEYNAQRMMEDMYRECTLRVDEFYRVNYNLDYVRDNFLKTATRNKVITAIVESAEMLNKAGEDVPNSTYDKIYKKINEALSLKVVEHQGTLFNDIADKLGDFLREQTRFDENAVVKTGIQGLDASLMAGGLLPGELFVVSAPPGRGKSSFLIHVGASAMLSGKNVCHILVGDNTVADGASRYASRLTMVPSMAVRANAQDYYNRWKAISEHSKVGKLIIESYCIGGPTINELRNFITRAQVTHDVKFDLIIIDYLDNCKQTVGSNSYERLGYLYEQCKALAEDLQVPIFTASQPKISSWKSSEGGLDVLAGSSLKQAVVDGMLTISPVAESEETGEHWLHLDKLRRGVSREKVRIKIDYSCQYISEVSR